MENFMIEYGVCIILCAIGLFFVIMTYGAHYAERSGVPFIGGFFIALGFLLSPIKWLALLGLVDPGYCIIPFLCIQDHIRYKRFESFYTEHDYAERAIDDTKRLRIWIPERNEEIIRHYSTNHMYQLRTPKLLFAVCIDKEGKRFMLIDKCIKGGNIEIATFDEGRIVFTGLKEKDTDMTVEIGIVRSEE